MSATYNDLRDFIAQVEGIGMLRHIRGADPDFEVGAITEVAAGKKRARPFCLMS